MEHSTNMPAGTFALAYPNHNREPICENKLLQQYLDTLSKKEYASYLIAKSHLGTSFQLEKSNGYLQWKKTQVLN